MVKHRLSVCQSTTPAADAVLQHLENMLGARDTALCENVTIGRAAMQSSSRDFISKHKLCRVLSEHLCSLPSPKQRFTSDDFGGTFQKMLA